MFLSMLVDLPHPLALAPLVLRLRLRRRLPLLLATASVGLVDLAYHGDLHALADGALEGADDVALAQAEAADIAAQPLLGAFQAVGHHHRLLGVDVQQLEQVGVGVGLTVDE